MTVRCKIRNILFRITQQSTDHHVSRRVRGTHPAEKFFFHPEKTCRPPFFPGAAETDIPDRIACFRIGEIALMTRDCPRCDMRRKGLFGYDVFRNITRDIMKNRKRLFTREYQRQFLAFMRSDHDLF